MFLRWKYLKIDNHKGQYYLYRTFDKMGQTPTVTATTGKLEEEKTQKNPTPRCSTVARAIRCMYNI